MKRTLIVIVTWLSTLALAGWVRSTFVCDSISRVNDIDVTWQSFGKPDESRRPAWSTAGWHEVWRITSADGYVIVHKSQSDTSFRTGSWRRSGWYLDSGPTSSPYLVPETGPLRAIGLRYGTFGDHPAAQQEWPSWAVSRTLAVHYWWIVLFSALLPAWQLLRWWRGRLTRIPGLCRACGYDLRATPQRCPECGAVAC